MTLHQSGFLKISERDDVAVALAPLNPGDSVTVSAPNREETVVVAAMHDRISDDMDFNCGTILEGETLWSAGEWIYLQVIDTASGKNTKSEQNGFGGREFVPWQLGAIR